MLKDALKRLSYVMESMDEHSPDVQKAAAEAIHKLCEQKEIEQLASKVCFLISGGQAVAYIAKNTGGGKIRAIKMVKDMTGWGLKDCKHVVEYLMKRHKHDM